MAIQRKPKTAANAAVNNETSMSLCFVSFCDWKSTLSIAEPPHLSGAAFGPSNNALK